MCQRFRLRCHQVTTCHKTAIAQSRTAAAKILPMLVRGLDIQQDLLCYRCLFSGREAKQDTGKNQQLSPAWVAHVIRQLR